MITDTTLESFKKLKKEGKLYPRQRDILRLLGFGTWTDRELSKELKLPINSITPRRNELVKLNLIEKKSKIHDNVTNRTVTLWGLK